MAIRYIGEATIRIMYLDDDTYAGTVSAPGVTWHFEGLRAPRAGFNFGYDSAQAYDRMAAAAVSFGSNPGEDNDPPREVARAIDDATAYMMDDRGDYAVRRQSPRLGLRRGPRR